MRLGIMKINKRTGPQTGASLHDSFVQAPIYLLFVFPAIDIVLAVVRRRLSLFIFPFRPAFLFIFPPFLFPFLSLLFFVGVQPIYGLPRLI